MTGYNKNKQILYRTKKKSCLIKKEVIKMFINAENLNYLLKKIILLKKKAAFKSGFVCIIKS